jgi:hypothetical protein
MLCFFIDEESLKQLRDLRQMQVRQDGDSIIDSLWHEIW